MHYRYKTVLRINISKVNILDLLYRSFDASRIKTESRQAVERLIQIKSDSFDPKSSKRASVAAAPLASWVIANVKYSHVMDKIKPLTREQNKLKE